MAGKCMIKGIISYSPCVGRCNYSSFIKQDITVVKECERSNTTSGPEVLEKAILSDAKDVNDVPDLKYLETDYKSLSVMDYRRCASFYLQSKNNYRLHSFNSLDASPITGTRQYSSTPSGLEKLEAGISDANLRNSMEFLKYLNLPSRDQKNRPSLLVQRRSLKMRREPGTICFPGGLQDDADSNDHVMTALRETQEEIGIDPDDVTIYGETAPFQTRNDQGMLHPVLGFVNLDFNNGQNPFKLNHEEVESVHMIPLENLLKQENWRYTRWKMGLALPVFRDEVFNDKDVPRVWGITAMITYFVMMAVFPNDYKFSYDILRIPETGRNK